MSETLEPVVTTVDQQKLAEIGPVEIEVPVTTPCASASRNCLAAATANSLWRTAGYAVNWRGAVGRLRADTGRYLRLIGYGSRRLKTPYSGAWLRGRTSSADYGEGGHDREYSARRESPFGSELRLAR
jgi:hypothetical protein